MHLLGPSLGTGLLGARPSPASRSADLARLLSLSGDLEPEEGVPRVPAMPSAPKLIPRILHQTYKSADVPQSARRLMLSWRTLHPGWDIRFYDDQDCLDFVRREFPEYLAAYRSLERDVQRSDFFRYMVVLRLGGVYADIDTEARQPLDGLLASSDTLVVGWESDFPDAQATVDAWYVRPRQVLQWVFAAAPGHPALRAACDRIAAGVATRHSLSPAIDTLERTGPGLFTDVVLEAAAGSPWAGAARDPWTVRILPRVAFGAPKAPAHGLTPLDPGVVVLHHFMGSWRSRRRAGCPDARCPRRGRGERRRRRGGGCRRTRQPRGGGECRWRHCCKCRCCSSDGDRPRCPGYNGNCRRCQGGSLPLACGRHPAGRSRSGSSRRRDRDPGPGPICHRRDQQPRRRR
ncbi:hypothetical protein ACKKBF_B34135 [Auxenochlorella protothecoides x Auxenochlorella symbiontica]